ncbi:MAG: hypothetical protein KA139_01365 [Rhodobacteraceae bacterium]|nr:hypothetical protein [Paracoccaceae bacterium]
MSVFADYLDLQTAVIEHVANADIADVMPRLVKMAETTFNNRLRVREMMDTITLNVLNGSANLPGDYLEAIGLFDGAGREFIQQPVHMIKEGRDNGFYAITDGFLLVNSDGARRLDYYAALPSLTLSMTANNWLLLRHPSLYLYAVGYEAAKYLRDLELAQATKALLEMEFAEVAAVDASARYSRARIILPGVTP